MIRSDAIPAAAAAGEIARLREMAARYGVDFIDAVPEEYLDPTLVARLPVEWARGNVLLPVRVGDELRVLSCDPAGVLRQEDLALVLGRDLRPLIAPRETILNAIERCYYRREDSPSDFLRDLGPSSAPSPAAVSGTDDLLRVAEKAPVTQLVNLILLEAVKRRASDIHFEPFENRLRVRYRIDGVLYEQTSPPKNMEEALVSRLKVMARMDISERRLPQDGMARVRVGEREIDIRVSTVPVAEGERVVLRLLDRDSALLPLDVLGMSQRIRAPIERLLTEPNGLIVVSGPTGSGKTTTLYAALGRLDAARRNIMTIEEPIEYQLPDIGQIQVKPKIGLTFASGLRHILRQDPDIVLVGETRDLETADIAVRAALTGHLVFTTLHTNDAPGAVLRLVDIGVEPYLLASCLKGVLAQRLVRRLCPACRRQVIATDGDCAGVDPLRQRVAGRPVWIPAGCPACLEGYAGRTGLFELMLIDRALQDIIRAGRSSGIDVRRGAEAAGMLPLLDDAVEKLLAGATSLAEVLAVAAT